MLVRVDGVLPEHVTAKDIMLYVMAQEYSKKGNCIGKVLEFSGPGLLHMGMDERQFIWIEADAPAERLWTTEQLIRSNAAGAVIAWLPKVRSDQLRRLQVCALACEGPVFLCRPDAARHEAAQPKRITVQ